MKEIAIKCTVQNGIVLTDLRTGSDNMSWDEFRMVVLEMIFNLAKFYFKKMEDKAQ